MTRYQLVVLHSGWHSECYRSPSPSAATIPSHLLARGEGWVPAGHDRGPLPGWEYALQPGAVREGYIRRARRTWYRRVRRQVQP